MKYVPGIIGIKITDPASTAKCVAILRKFTSAPISEIVSAIKSNSYVVTCEYTSDSGVNRIARCYDQLTDAGIAAEIYEHDSLATREFLSNLIHSYRIIAEQTEATIEAEVAAEEEMT